MMTLRSRVPFTAAVAALALGAASAHAQESDAADVAAPPPSGGTALPPNVVQLPDGTVSVGRTPERGVDVHAATPSGTVHAWGCQRVDVDPRGATAAAPCPTPYYYYPYPAYPPPPVYYYRPPVYYQPVAYQTVAQPPPKPRYAPDPARKGALIGSSLLFGIGTAAAGAAYVSSISDDSRWCDGERCSRGPSKPALYTMGAIETVSPSIPRYVVGDVGVGLLFTGLRAASFATGAFIDWEDRSYVLPTTLAFVVPVTLGIVDLATTPHREQLEPKPTKDAKAVKLEAIGPTALLDRSGSPAPSFAAAGRFF